MNSAKREKIELKDLYPLILKATESGGEILIYPSGESMRPTIRPERGDGVLLRRAQHIRRGDVLLYRRPSGAFVLHRVIAITRRGSYVMRGDNQYQKEYIGRDTEIIAKVGAIVRTADERLLSRLRGRICRALWRIGYPIRYVLYRVRRKLKNLSRRKEGA